MALVAIDVVCVVTVVVVVLVGANVVVVAEAIGYLDVQYDCAGWKFASSVAIRA